MMSFSRSVPRLRVVNSQMMPVLRSITGHGLPTVFAPSSPMTRSGDQVAPRSTLRFITRSISPASALPPRRPSANASSVPFGVARREGIRKVW
jgi:hypothetical protein